uniref:Uncharacterized protein n=1 Tax=Heterorhabditis bacteriophora TaxID=37862 RepID=A0A1I7XV28_HETBA
MYFSLKYRLACDNVHEFKACSYS